MMRLYNLQSPDPGGGWTKLYDHVLEMRLPADALGFYCWLRSRPPGWELKLAEAQTVFPGMSRKQFYRTPPHLAGCWFGHPPLDCPARPARRHGLHREPRCARYGHTGPPNTTASHGPKADHNPSGVSTV